MEVVINNTYGRYSLSDEAKGWLAQEGHEWHVTWNGVTIDLERNDPLLIRCVKALGTEAAGRKGTALKIVEVPDDVDWYIEEDDGLERVAEQHRLWQ